MTRPNYGPNYRTEAEEAKALRAERATSWFDAWAFALLLACLLVVPAWFAATNHLTHQCYPSAQTWCTVAKAVQ